MGKVLTGRQIVEKEFKSIEGLSQKFTDSFGDIEDTFSAIFSGESGNGKTSLITQVLKELQVLGEVLYLGLEEGHAKSFKKALVRSDLDLDKIKVYDDLDFDELNAVLDRRFSPKIVVIDSIQYMGLTYIQYKILKRKYLFGRKANARKILIFISHSNGKTIDGKAAFSIRHDCMVKGFVKGYLCFMISRFEPKKNFIIWEAGAKDYWGDKYDDHTAEIGKKKRKKTVKKPKENTATKTDGKED
jgi:KaiC/GvpD/RAD55 family RecA-like ATPase